VSTTTSAHLRYNGCRTANNFSTVPTPSGNTTPRLLKLPHRVVTVCRGMRNQTTTANVWASRSTPPCTTDPPVATTPLVCPASMESHMLANHFCSVSKNAVGGTEPARVKSRPSSVSTPRSFLARTDLPDPGMPTRMMARVVGLCTHVFPRDRDVELNIAASKLDSF
jgi:hypothetical protein